ncbi:ABC transporter permease [Litorilinea aerophila]|uniref:ABC transporter permease n=1 Tax=Litorilinea aerophila TaxID=1204385 RepID=A0A540VLQ0_9CHLR
MERRVVVSMTLLLGVLAVLSLFVGAHTLTLNGLLAWDSTQLRVFLASRVPRLVAILTAGMGMGVVGLVMQQLARNRFVAPSTAGTVESATLGILVALLLFPAATMLQKMGIAFIFALAGTVLFLQMLARIPLKDVIIVPLVGIMFGRVIGAVTTFFAYRHDLLQSLGAWTNGDFSGVLRGRYELLYVAIPAVMLAYWFADRFTLAGMGEDFARNLGLNYQQVLYLGLSIVALVTAVVVLTVGAIPFLGLIVPNVVSLLLGDHMRRTLPYTAWGGALLVLACDLLGRLIRYPYEIPVGTIVGVLGSGIFLLLILRREAYAAG